MLTLYLPVTMRETLSIQIVHELYTKCVIKVFYSRKNLWISSVNVFIGPEVCQLFYFKSKQELLKIFNLMAYTD